MPWKSKETQPVGGAESGCTHWDANAPFDRALQQVAFLVERYGLPGRPDDGDCNWCGYHICNCQPYERETT